MISKGLVYGRFQVMHLKHMEYILAAKMRCDKLYIGITFPDDMYVSEEDGVNYRTKRSANPMTYIERMEMITQALLEFGIPRDQFEVIPFPIDRPHYLAQYTPTDSVCFMSVCDEWTEKNERLFQRLGIPTNVLWRRDESEKGVTGTEVRQRILAGERWENLVPKSVSAYVKTHGIDNRIRYTK